MVPGILPRQLGSFPIGRTHIETTLITQQEPQYAVGCSAQRCMQALLKAHYTKYTHRWLPETSLGIDRARSTIFRIWCACTKLMYWNVANLIKLNESATKPADQLLHCPAASVSVRTVLALSSSPQTLGLLFAYGRLPQRSLVVEW